MEGFGEKSYQNLIASVDKARVTTLETAATAMNSETETK